MSLHEQLLFLQESGAMFGIQPTLKKIYKMILKTVSPVWPRACFFMEIVYTNVPHSSAVVMHFRFLKIICKVS